MSATIASLFQGPEPVLVLAPMQDVTDWAFWNLIARYGGADLYFTEYFRVHPDSRLDRPILKSIVENPTGRPVVAQMIGNDIPALVRTARELQRYPVVSIDLNLGCPAPVVYRKCAGGGLLRDPARIDSILGALRDAVKVGFSVKTRLGFEDPSEFERLLPIFAKHSIDLLTVHGRTVTQLYRGEVHYDWIARAAAELRCPVIANGNIRCAQTAADVLEQTGAHGLMIGRWAIQNPWLFRQIRQQRRGEPVFRPAPADWMAYLRALYFETWPAGLPERSQVQKMKKYMNFVGAGNEPFLHEVRRATTEGEFFEICGRFLGA